MTKYENPLAPKLYVGRILGPSIQMGDGSYFDFDAPETTTMTIEDYAWALAATNRFRGQTRLRNLGHIRCLYNVAQHCTLGAHQVFKDTGSKPLAFAFLMHESDEVPLGDMVGPAKPLLPEYKALARDCGNGIDQHFGVTCPDHDLIKKYDIRMLVTEKRDLMPQGGDERWPMLDGYEPFDWEVIPISGGRAAVQFMQAYEAYRP
jgi:hypothetical protein